MLPQSKAGEKLQKILARCGLGSRREIEAWLTMGRVTVNGKKAKLGDRADPNAAIAVDGRIIRIDRLPTKSRVLLYHKPVGEVTSRKDEEGRPTVFDRLPRLRDARWINIGRLDYNTAGLLMFTTDGELAHRLMHPSSQIEREYAVRILGKASQLVLENLKTGVMLEDGKAKFDDLRDAGGEGANHWYHVIVRQGKNRIVRRLWESQGYMASRLIRVRFGQVTLPKFLRAGRWHEMEPEKIQHLYADLDKLK